MIYSGKESQTVSNGHESGAITIQTTVPAPIPVVAPALTSEISMTSELSTPESASPIDGPAPGVYYNARFDPKNFLEGPLSLNPATRLRQMLARPGIVVSLLMKYLRYDALC